ncbi:MAG TPA: ATP-binding protein [Terriglobia bacterium]|nr:ATP-binding protein [Terriglobia bacterium]
MTAQSEVIEVTLASTLESVEKAEELALEVCAKAGFDEEEQHRIGMAVHESIINAVRHGNKMDSKKRVGLQFFTLPDRVEIRIRDQGAGFDLSAVPDPLETGNLLKVSGRGIFLIRAFVDEFRVRPLKDAGTEVTLVKFRHMSNTIDQGGKHREHEGKNAPH